jgi:hypothetical protein
MKNYNLSIILFSIIVVIATIFLFINQRFEEPYFIKYSQQGAEDLSTIIKEFYQNNAQRSFSSNITKFIQDLSPYTLEAILIEDIKNDSFYSKLEYSIGLHIYFYKYDQNHYISYNINKRGTISDNIEEWELDNGQLVLTYHQKLFSDIGTIYLVFSESNMGNEELRALRSYNNSSFIESLKKLIRPENIHFMLLIIIPTLTLLLLFLSYREVRNRGHLKQFSPQINIVILIIFLGITLIVYFCIDPSISVQYSDERWYAEKMLEKARQLHKSGNEKLSGDYIEDIEKQYLPDKEQQELSKLQNRLR